MPIEKALHRGSRIHVAGHRGLAGSAIWRNLIARGFTNLVGAASSELDLRDRQAVFAFMKEKRPDVVIDAAGRVGGIHANNAFPHEFLSDNLQIQVNLMDAANDVGVERLLFLGSSCIYPKNAPQPIKETSLLTGELEPTNEAYAIAKIAGTLQVQAIRRQYGRHWICAMPTNLYGPGDSFDPEHAHVLPALMRRFQAAKDNDSPAVVVWGTGTPRREFLYADDLADAALFLLDNYDAPEPINVGTGRDIAIRDLATLVADVVGYRGQIVQDPSRFDGTAQKRLDVSRLSALGWHARTGLREGVTATHRWYVRHQASVRGR
jgi:GDP-L-fucose synthase